MDDRNPQSRKNPIKYKFLRSAMQIENEAEDDESVLKLLSIPKMRRMYFRKIHEGFFPRHNWRDYYSKGKQLSCLTDLKIEVYKSHGKKFVKSLRNLKNVNISIEYSSSLKDVNRFIKALPKNIETITFPPFEITTKEADIQSFYGSLSRNTNLRILQNDLRFKKAARQGGHEFINLPEIEYLSRLRDLKELRCKKPIDDIQKLQQLMGKGQESRFVKYLSISLCQNMLGPYDIEGYNTNKPVNQIAPAFGFESFTSLQQLTILTDGEDIALDLTVSQAFKSLLQLKQLSLDISRIIHGRKFLFEGLLHLPLLARFNLLIPDIENDENPLLIKFLDKQTQLVSLSVILRASLLSREKYEEYNKLLDMICKTLNDKAKLSHLCLHGTGWSLENLSRGLDQVGMKNQLKEFATDIFDDFFSAAASVTPPKNRIEGLCNFIKRQKLSLRSLTVSIECVKDDEIIDGLIKAISEIDKLELLNLALNTTLSYNSPCNNKLIENILEDPLPGCPSFNKTFAYLGQTLQDLKELSDLRLSLMPLQHSEDSTASCSALLNVLPSLNLRSAWLYLPFRQSNFISSFLKMKTLLTCFLKDFKEMNEIDWEKYWELDGHKKYVMRHFALYTLHKVIFNSEYNEKKVQFF